MGRGSARTVRAAARWGRGRPSALNARYTDCFTRGHDRSPGARLRVRRLRARRETGRAPVARRSDRDPAEAARAPVLSAAPPGSRRPEGRGARRHLAGRGRERRRPRERGEAGASRARRRRQSAALRSNPARAGLSLLGPGGGPRRAARRRGGGSRWERVRRAARDPRPARAGTRRGAGRPWSLCPPGRRGGHRQDPRRRGARGVRAEAGDPGPPRPLLRGRRGSDALARRAGALQARGGLRRGVASRAARLPRPPRSRSSFPGCGRGSRFRSSRRSSTRRRLASGSSRGSSGSSNGALAPRKGWSSSSTTSTGQTSPRSD